MGKLDSKASEMVFGVCKQIEGAVMRSKNVANETAYDARHAVVHLVGNHTNDALVGGFLGKTYF